MFKSASFLILFILGNASLALAQEDFDQWRMGFNRFVSDVFSRKKCQDINLVCETEISPLKDKSLNNILAPHQALDLEVGEKQFFEAAATEQFKFLSCDVNQLEAMSKRDQSSVDFQKELMDDIADKLPTMRELYKVIQRGQAELIAKNQSGAPRGDGIDPINTGNKARDMEKIASSFSQEAHLFNTMLASIWRFDDPDMYDFIMRAVVSKKSPDEISKEALRSEARDSFIATHILGYDEFSLQEQVFTPMLRRASLDRNSLLRASLNGHGGGYIPSTMPIELRKALVERSHYGHVLKNLSSGDQTTGVLMCELERRYVHDPAVVDNIITAGSTLVGVRGFGKGLTGLVRMALGRPPETYASLIAQSMTLAIGAVAVATPVISKQIKAQCFPASPAHVLQSKGRACNENNPYEFFHVQRVKVQQENCVLAGMIIGAGALPWSNFAFKYLGPALRNKLASSPHMLSALVKSGETIKRARLPAAAVSIPTMVAAPVIAEDIIVTGKKKPSQKKNQTSGAK